MIKPSLRLRHSVERSMAGKQNKQQVFPAVMGDGFGNVETDREGYVYVRVGNQVRVVYNNAITPQNNLPVMVGITNDMPNQLKILSVRNLSNADYDGKVVIQPISRHAASHEWGRIDANGSTDVVFVDLRQFMPLRLTPFGQMNVGITRGIVPGYTGSWYWNDPNLINLDGIQPTTSGSSRWVLFSMTYGGDLVVTTGSFFTGTPSLDTLPDGPADKAIDVGAVRLYAGQYQVADVKESTDIVDLRFPTKHTHTQYVNYPQRAWKSHRVADYTFVTGSYWLDIDWDLKITAECLPGIAYYDEGGAGEDTSILVITGYDGIVDVSGCVRPEWTGAPNTTVIVASRILFSYNSGGTWTEARCLQSVVERVRQANEVGTQHYIGSVRCTGETWIKLQSQVSDTGMLLSGWSGFDNPVAATITVSHIAYDP